MKKICLLLVSAGLFSSCTSKPVDAVAKRHPSATEYACKPPPYTYAWQVGHWGRCGESPAGKLSLRTVTCVGSGDSFDATTGLIKDFEGNLSDASEQAYCCAPPAPPKFRRCSR